MADRRCHQCLGLGVVDDRGYPLLGQPFFAKQSCPRCGHTGGKPAQYPGLITERGLIQNPCWAVVTFPNGPRLLWVRIDHQLVPGDDQVAVRQHFPEHPTTTPYITRASWLFNDHAEAESNLAEVVLCE